MLGGVVILTKENKMSKIIQFPSKPTGWIKAIEEWEKQTECHLIAECLKEALM